MDVIIAALTEMAAHTQANPTHGHNCACKDRQLGAIRKFLRENPDLREEFLYVAPVMMRSHWV